MKILNITKYLYSSEIEVSVEFEEIEYHKLIQNSFFKRLILNDKTLLDARITAVSFIPDIRKIESWYKVIFKCRKFFDTEEEYESFIDS